MKLDEKLEQTYSTTFPNRQAGFHFHMEKAILDNDISNLKNTILNRIKNDK